MPIETVNDDPNSPLYVVNTPTTPEYIAPTQEQDLFAIPANTPVTASGGVDTGPGAPTYAAGYIDTSAFSALIIDINVAVATSGTTPTIKFQLWTELDDGTKELLYDSTSVATPYASRWYIAANNDVPHAPPGKVSVFQAPGRRVYFNWVVGGSAGPSFPVEVQITGVP